MKITPAGSAVISQDGRYRYHLSRKIGGGGGVATFIMLNPSTADALKDDPTIRRCLGFCRRWGCGELHVVNLFAVRARNPDDLRKAPDPVGPENRDWVQRVAAQTAQCGPVVCAWGMYGTYIGQDRIVSDLIKDICRPRILGLTRHGHPRHPLYVPYGARLVPFSGRP
jgi:hypothetical protein